MCLSAPLGAPTIEVYVAIITFSMMRSEDEEPGSGPTAKDVDSFDAECYASDWGVLLNVSGEGPMYGDNRPVCYTTRVSKTVGTPQVHVDVALLAG